MFEYERADVVQNPEEDFKISNFWC